MFSATKLKFAWIRNNLIDARQRVIR
jgi:hypothetical protein